MAPPRTPEDGGGPRLAQALRLGMGVELAGTPEEVRRAVQAYWRAGLEAPKAVAARAITRLLDMGEPPTGWRPAPPAAPRCAGGAGAAERA